MRNVFGLVRLIASDDEINTPPIESDEVDAAQCGRCFVSWLSQQCWLWKMNVFGLVRLTGYPCEAHVTTNNTHHP